MIEITLKDLPLSCPRQGQALWNVHPRVFLPIKDTKKATCPYCGTQFILKETQDKEKSHE